MNKFKVIKNNMYIIKYYFKYTPIFLVLFLLLEIITSISHVLLLPYSLLIVTDPSMDLSKLNNVIIILLLIFVLSLFISFFRCLFQDIYSIRAHEKVNKILQEELYTLAKSTNISDYDIPKFYEHLYLSIDEIDKRTKEVLETLRKFVYSVTGIICIVSIVLSLSPIALVFILLTFIFNLLLENFTEKITFKLDISNKPNVRKKDYIRRVFFIPEYISEIKLHDYYDILMNKYKDANVDEINIKNRYKKRLFILHGPIDFFINFIFAFVIFNAVLIYQIIYLKTLTIGGFAAIFFASGSLEGHLSRIINVFAEFQRHSLYIGNILEFIKKRDVDNTSINICDDNFDTIKIKNLSFSYPNEKNKLINNMNFNILKGETIGIVGRNGAGKTTLIKLILNLYNPTFGEILIKDKNIKFYNSEEYRNKFGVVFQDFNLYALSLRENIIMNNVYDEVSCKAECDVDSKVLNSLEYAGFDRSEDNINLDTVISNEIEDGRLFSGGEAQKIALSRIIYSNKNYIILDEPSSALDPISEYDFNKKIIEFSKDRTVLIISHRLATTALCDRILYIEDGKIVEQGTHKELMELDGKYKYMYNIQSQKYLSD